MPSAEDQREPQPRLRVLRFEEALPRRCFGEVRVVETPRGRQDFGTGNQKHDRGPEFHGAS